MHCPLFHSLSSSPPLSWKQKSCSELLASSSLPVKLTVLSGGSHLSPSWVWSLLCPFHGTPPPPFSDALVLTICLNQDRIAVPFALSAGPLLSIWFTVDERVLPSPSLSYKLQHYKGISNTVVTPSACPHTHTCILDSSLHCQEK